MTEDFSRFASGFGLSTEALETRIQRELEELKSRYRQAQRIHLIPEISKTDYLQSGSVAESASVEDYAIQASIADRKSKIGVIFGSDVSKKFGKVSKASGVIIGKIFRLGLGKDYRTTVQTAWANRLLHFYNSLFDGLENKAFLQEIYGAHFTTITERLKEAVEKSETSVDRAIEGNKAIRSLKGAVLIALVPDELKKRFIMDITDAYLQLSGTRNVNGSVVAQFVVPEDPFPYLWQSPKGAIIKPVEEGRKLVDVFDMDRELSIEWEDEGAKARYFPTGDFEPDGFYEKKVFEKDEEGNLVEKEIELPVYSLRNDQDYQKQFAQFQEKLDNYGSYSQLSFGEPYIETLAQKKAKPGQQYVGYYLSLIKEVYGSLLEKSTNGIRVAFGGLLAYKMFMGRLKTKESVAKVIKLFEEIQLKKKQKEDFKVELDELANHVKNIFYPHSSLEGAELQKAAVELGFTFKSVTVIPEIEKVISGNTPRSVYDPNVYNNGVYPAVSSTVHMETVHEGQQVSVKAPTRPNPFNVPKMWPVSINKSDYSWPDVGATSLTMGGFMKTRWRKVPWSTLSLEAKRNNIEKMREELEGIEDPIEKNNLGSDVRIVEKALFMDELRAFIKLNIAFNIDDPSNPSVVSKVAKAPPLFWIKREDELIPVTITHLVDEDSLEALTNIMRINKNSSIDIATDEESNFGFLHDQPNYITELLRKQLRAQKANLIERLKRLAQIEGEEFCFDLEGNFYPNRRALEQHLIRTGDPFSLDQKVEMANIIREEVARAIAKDNEFIELVDYILSLYSEKPEESEEKFESQTVPESLKIPGDHDEGEFLPFENQLEKQEPLQVAARVIKRFTK